MECWTFTPTLHHPIPLSLPLFVAFVAANDPDDAFAPDDFTILAKFLY
jgi:hypothetical protein